MTSKDRRSVLQSKRQCRDWLIESLRTYLFPAFAEHGFDPAQVVKRGPIDREYVQSLPLGRLLRRSKSRLELLEIQFAPYGRAAFRINTGIPPNEGIMTLTGHWAPEELDAGGLSEHFQMYALPRWWKWFSVWRWPGQSLSKSDYDKLAIRVAGYVPELELALNEGRLGPHMRRITIPHPSFNPTELSG